MAAVRGGGRKMGGRRLENFSPERTIGTESIPTPTCPGTCTVYYCISPKPCIREQTQTVLVVCMVRVIRDTSDRPRGHYFITVKLTNELGVGTTLDA